MKSLQEPPDGGWGWVVVFAAFIGLAISSGFMHAFGILYVAFLDAFGESKAATAWINGIFTIVCVIASSHGIALSRRFGHRKTVMGAGVLSALGILGSAFATNLYQVYFTYGIVTGIGFGLAYLNCVEMVSIYFAGRFPLAVGLAMAGSGAGQVILSIVAQILVDQYGWRGMLLIMSGFTSHLLIAGALFRPLNVQELIRQKPNNTESTKTGNSKITTSDWSTKLSTEQNQPNNCQRLKTCSSSLKSYCMTVYDLSLFKSPVFIMLGLTAVGQIAALLASAVHIVRRARDYGISDIQSAYIPAAMGLGQMVGRPCFGLVGHVTKLNPSIPFAFALFVCGVVLIVSTYAKSFTAQVIFIAIYGMCAGGFMVYIPIVVKHFLGNDKIGHGMAFVFHVQGICGLFIGPLGGWVRDTTGAYDGTFWFSGMAAIVAAVLALLLPVVDRLAKHKRRKVRLEAEAEMADDEKSSLHETFVVAEFTTTI